MFNNNVKDTNTKNNTPKADELSTDVDQMEAMDLAYADEGLLEDYVPVNQTGIPLEAIEAYETRGFELQWARIFQDGELDSKNIKKKESEKYEFVKRNEIPGLAKGMSSFFGDELDKGSHGLYMVGDVALVKISHARLKAKREYLNRKVGARTKAVVDRLEQENLMPSADRNEGWKVERSTPNGTTTSFGK